jgi:tetratricopeptide (TPR) repeat protein
MSDATNPNVHGLPAPLVSAASFIAKRSLSEAERILRPYLKEQPDDVNAIRMLGEIGLELGALRDADNLLARCVELAPDYSAGRYSYASVLYKRHRYAQAIDHIDLLLQSSPENPAYLALKAANLVEISQHETAIGLFEQVLTHDPNNESVRLSLGHALRAIGQNEEAIATYRSVSQGSEQYGEAYWSLANLKTYRFSDDDIRQMKQTLENKNCSYRTAYHLCFALGKALEDTESFKESAWAYAKGNELKSKTVPWDSNEFKKDTDELIDFFSEERIKGLSSSGLNVSDPIFIVGLPRAGSTLIEQILASHSQVEGTAELANMIAIARTIANKTSRQSKSKYPADLSRLDATALVQLGQRYLDETQLQRITTKPFFIDKMPNNFSHVGLIHMLLPKAKIIDARRNPMDCCFSGYKQLFASGQGFTYGQKRIARYYQEYERLMSHWDTVLPGKVHRVHYEAMICDPEAEIRALLSFCELPFEEACLTFHETSRTVRTASSEQVRQPINRKGLDAWKPFENWLTPMREALQGSVDRYPEF